MPSNRIKNDLVETCFSVIHARSTVNLRHEKCLVIITVSVQTTCSNVMLNVNLGYDSRVPPTHAGNKKNHADSWRKRNRDSYWIDYYFSFVLTLVMKGHFCHLQKPCPGEGVLNGKSAGQVARRLWMSHFTIHMLIRGDVIR